jgi:hypothetical protein
MQDGITAVLPKSHCELSILNGGEGGIRTFESVQESASCRLLVAAPAVAATRAVAPCTPLHAGIPR